MSDGPLMFNKTWNCLLQAVIVFLLNFFFISDVQGTERVFRKCINTSQNALRLVDKDGIPLRMPNTAHLSRLRSSYVLSPRGVPTRKTDHAYSGQLAQAKMRNLVINLHCFLLLFFKKPI